MTKHKVLQTTLSFSLRRAIATPAGGVDQAQVTSSPSALPLSQRMSRVVAQCSLSGLVMGLTWVSGVAISLEGFATLPRTPDQNPWPIRWQSLASAQQLSPQLRQDFLSDPLTAEPRDPLLPDISVQRPLSPLELRDLSIQLDALSQVAQEQLLAGDTEAAFASWRREVRLRRVLGPVEEFNAIQGLAQLAWERQRPVDVQLLTLRAREVWQTVQAALGAAEIDASFPQADPADEDAPARQLVGGRTASDIAVLNAIAQTFITLRDLDSTVAVYEQLIALTSAQGDSSAQQRSLAELHLSWFQFAEAADVYLALLTQARSQGNQAQEVDALERLVYSYQQANSLLNAVRAQTDLLSLYQARGEETKLPGLLLAIAQNYRTLERPDTAIEYYRAAYSAAQRFDQFSFSAQVLKDLGSLYQALSRPSEALGAYNLLIPVEQQAYNSYGVMNAYDNIGQLQRLQGNASAALTAFEQGLAIANQLNFRQDYFTEQIQSLSQGSPDSQGLPSLVPPTPAIPTPAIPFP
jgi:tetratricopeptide (TPR) repeat protein